MFIGRQLPLTQYVENVEIDREEQNDEDDLLERHLRTIALSQPSSISASRGMRQSLEVFSNLPRCAKAQTIFNFWNENKDT